MEEIHKSDQTVAQRTQQRLVAIFRERKTRKWIWIAVGSFIALQIYFVQELLAALALFTGVFILFGMIALVLYLIDRAGQWGLGWAGKQARPAVKLARKSLTVVEEVSKKPFRRPRSETAP